MTTTTPPAPECGCVIKSHIQPKDGATIVDGIGRDECEYPEALARIQEFGQSGFVTNLEYENRTMTARITALEQERDLAMEEMAALRIAQTTDRFELKKVEQERDKLREAGESALELLQAELTKPHGAQVFRDRIAILRAALRGNDAKAE